MAKQHASAVREHGQGHGQGIEGMLDIQRRVDRNPYGMIAGAVGVGFILGGGLFTRLTAKLVGVGLRMAAAAAIPFVQDEILRGVSEIAGGSHSPSKKDKREKI